MQQGGLEIVLIIAILLNLSLGVYILVKFKALTSRTDNQPANPPGQQPEIASAEDHAEKSPLMDIIRDQLAYSREDVSELQEEVEKLTLQVAGLRGDVLIHLVANSKEAKVDIGRVEIELGKIVNRLDNYRFLLSKLEENSRR